MDAISQAEFNNGLDYLDAVEASSPFSMALVFRRFEAATDTSAAVGEIAASLGVDGIGGQASIAAAINLPLPNNLTEGYQVVYDREDNTMQRFIAQVLSGASGQITAGASAKEISDALGQSAAGTLRGLNPSNAFAMTGALMNGAGFGGQDLGLDYVFNPSMSNVFEGVAPRSFNFTWRVYPKSEAESQTYMDIVNTIKNRILPPEAAGGAFGPFKIVRYPDVLDITILAGGKEVFPIQTSVVTNFAVNYGPSGVPTFFTDDKPTHIEFSMEIREAHSLTREDLQNMGPTFGGNFF